jgi:hypothetical protein
MASEKNILRSYTSDTVLLSSFGTIAFQTSVSVVPGLERPVRSPESMMTLSRVVEFYE